MLCSDCKKNMAIIYINKIDKDSKDNKEALIGLCADCAKKRGIDPLKNIKSKMENMSHEDINNLNSQFEGLLANIDIEKLSSMFGNIDGSFDEPENPEIGQDEKNNGFSFGFAKKQTSQEEKSNSNVKTREKKINKKIKFLEAYGTNLTKLAREEKLDKVIGREKELERLIQILNRRSKNNPALIGEPGVGKTAVINALALKIAAKDVPQKLMNKEVYLLDMTSMVAGTQFRGQFESRMKGVIDECASYSNIILAIDELHNIVGGLEHDNSMNAGNILKPALSNGSVQVIGATTIKEYRKYIEKDSALERRFQPIIVDEPSLKDTVEILKGIKKYYENHHKIIIPNSVLVDAVNLSEKYIFERFLPDKAIDLLDEACSRVYLDNKVLGQIENIEEHLKEIEIQIEETEEEIAEKANSNSSDEMSEFQKTADLKAAECSLKNKLDELNKKVERNTLTFENLAKVVELWTKIPVSRLTTSESEKLLKLEDHLNKRIIGQEKAVHALSNAILRKRSNIKSVVRPPSFIFVGPTGVGKTALVKALAYELFDREESIIRLDMSEYMESHSISKLIGSPPGYVGFDDAGYLTEKVRRNPYSIILFDEIEKAHPSIFNILLQILEDGILTDSQGKTVSFKNTVVILTSNLGTNFKNEGYGFANENINKDMLNKKVEGALKEYFSPEFLNRIDNTIIFNKLSKKDALGITKLLLKEYSKELLLKKIKLEYSSKLIEFISKKGFSDKFGARPLKRAITTYIEDPIAHGYITGKIQEKNDYLLDIDKDKEELIIKQNKKLNK